jgi:hypothetical protein
MWRLVTADFRIGSSIFEVVDVQRRIISFSILFAVAVAIDGAVRPS